MEKRVNRIEDQVAKIFSEVANLNKRIGKMNNRMLVIEKAAVQVKYTAFGALGVFVLTQVGLLEFLKLVK